MSVFRISDYGKSREFWDIKSIADLYDVYKYLGKHDLVISFDTGTIAICDAYVTVGG